MADKTGNPALNQKTFDQFSAQALVGAPMTLAGTVQKSFMLLSVVIIAAAFSWYTFSSTASQLNQTAVMGLAAGSGIVAFILSLIIIFNKKTSPVLSWFYCAFEGILLGAISAACESQFHGLVLNAVGLTFGTFLAMLFAYQSGLIKPTERFRLGVVAATGGICIMYLVDMVLKSFFHLPIMLIHDNGLVGILFSAFVVVIAALNLILDFNFISTGVQRQAPKYMEWYASFGLMVTLVWLYLEILRMLAKSRSR
jgi:uncharacterized YccA/Bax inhibitor family protein